MCFPSDRMEILKKWTSTPSPRTRLQTRSERTVTLCTPGPATKPVRSSCNPDVSISDFGVRPTLGLTHACALPRAKTNTRIPPTADCRAFSTCIRRSIKRALADPKNLLAAQFISAGDSSRRACANSILQSSLKQRPCYNVSSLNYDSVTEDQHVRAPVHHGKGLVQR